MRALDERLGEGIYRWWALKRTLAETRRPELVSLLSPLASSAGGLMLLECLLVGRLMKRPVPGHATGDPGPVTHRRRQVLLLLAVAAASGSAAGPLLEKRPIGSYLAAVMALSSVGAGGVLARDRALSPTAMLLGLLDIMSGMAVWVILSFCWYSLDPLRLHGDPGSQT